MTRRPDLVPAYASALLWTAAASARPCSPWRPWSCPYPTHGLRLALDEDAAGVWCCMVDAAVRGCDEVVTGRRE
jgi:hypothetical protein